MTKADVHIRLDAKLWKWVRMEAAKKGLNPNDVIADAIDAMRAPNGAKS